MGTSQVQTDLFAGESGHAIFRRFQYLTDRMKYQKKLLQIVEEHKRYTERRKRSTGGSKGED